MSTIMRFVGFVLISTFTLSNVFVAQAALPTPTSVGHSPQLTSSSLYLPLINKGYTILNEAVGVIEPAAQAGLFNTPFDATPDPEGNTIYFTAKSAQGAGVFSVPAAGGAATALTVGAPFTAPVGLAISTAGQVIYVADPSATVANATKGAIFSLAITGGAPKAITDTIGTAPRGLEVVQENGIDMIYFTGVNPADNLPAVMKIPATGGALSVVAKGDPFVNPVGVTIDKHGIVYVTDDAASAPDLGTVFRITGGQVEVLTDHVHLGKPAGITLTLDESLLLISALDVNTGGSQVLVIDLQTLQQGIVNKVIGVNHASGGLHRAHHRDVMAWADLTAGTAGGGLVYRINFK
ncbi:hypothetical protein BH10CHL1_BH10CHL1_10020 [soil metagenome]